MSCAATLDEISSRRVCKPCRGRVCGLECVSIVNQCKVNSVVLLLGSSLSIEEVFSVCLPSWTSAWVNTIEEIFVIMFQVCREVGHSMLEVFPVCLCDVKHFSWTSARVNMNDEIFVISVCAGRFAHSMLVWLYWLKRLTISDCVLTSDPFL